MWTGNTRSQGGMWSASVVVGHPGHQSFPQMPFAQRNDPIEGLKVITTPVHSPQANSLLRTADRDSAAGVPRVEAAGVTSATSSKHLKYFRIDFLFVKICSSHLLTERRDCVRVFLLVLMSKLGRCRLLNMPLHEPNSHSSSTVANSH
jgi:hypothetical protein